MTDISKGAPSPSNGHEKPLLILLIIAAFFAVAFHVSPLWGFADLISFKFMLIGLAVVSFINASLLLGYRSAFVFLCLGAIIGYSFEQVGIWTGAIFGPYIYTEILGMKIIDVPWVIPVCWFAAVYLAHVIANLIIKGRPEAVENRISHIAILSGLTALVATGLDMALDPAMSHKTINAWIWTDGGAYFGVPFKNFQGWVIVAFLIDFLFRLYARKAGTRPISGKYKQISVYACLAWIGLGVGYMLIGRPVETQLVAVFTVLLPAFLALTSLYLRPQPN